MLACVVAIIKLRSQCAVCYSVHGRPWGDAGLKDSQRCGGSTGVDDRRVGLCRDLGAVDCCWYDSDETHVDYRMPAEIGR